MNFPQTDDTARRIVTRAQSTNVTQGHITYHRTPRWPCPRLPWFADGSSQPLPCFHVLRGTESELLTWSPSFGPSCKTIRTYKRQSKILVSFFISSRYSVILISSNEKKIHDRGEHPNPTKYKARWNESQPAADQRPKELDWAEQSWAEHFKMR